MRETLPARGELVKGTVGGRSLSDRVRASDCRAVPRGRARAPERTAARGERFDPSRKTPVRRSPSPREARWLSRRASNSTTRGARRNVPCIGSSSSPMSRHSSSPRQVKALGDPFATLLLGAGRCRRSGAGARAALRTTADRRLRRAGRGGRGSSGGSSAATRSTRCVRASRSPSSAATSSATSGSRAARSSSVPRSPTACRSG